MMNKKERKRIKRKIKKSRNRTKEERMQKRREQKRISDLAFGISFASTLMAIRDLNPDIKIEVADVTARMHSILNEFNTIGNKELDMFVEVCKEEFDTDLKKL